MESQGAQGPQKSLESSKSQKSSESSESQTALSSSHLLVGGEVHLWSELTDSVNLDGKLWPRAAAAAEILWKGPVGVGGVSEGVTRRLAEWRERVVGKGVRAEVVQMTWCLMNEGGCGV